MSGTVLTERVAGIPSGWPAEMDASVKVRFVAPVLMNMSERSADFLKYIGGVDTFSFTNTTLEWVEDDVWNRRLTQSGLANGTTFVLVVTGAAHRYPVGTILFNATVGEYTRVTGHVDANTLQIDRDIIAAVSEGAWASTDEVLVAGLSMDENDDYVFRPTSIFSLPYNRPQIFQTGVQASFRRMETALYGIKGSDLDNQASNMVMEQYVAMEDASIFGQRFDGTSGVPAMFGGLKFYVTSANGAQSTNLNSAPLSRGDIDNQLQNFFYTVGGEKIPKTLLVGAWGKRKISSFFSATERMGPQASGPAGVIVDKLNTDFGVIDVMLHTAVAKNEAWFIRKEQIQMGHHGQLGAPQLRQLPPSSVGPRTQKVFYADMSMIVAGVQAMGRIFSFSTSA